MWRRLQAPTGYQPLSSEITPTSLHQFWQHSSLGLTWKGVYQMNSKQQTLTQFSRVVIKNALRIIERWVSHKSSPKSLRPLSTPTYFIRTHRKAQCNQRAPTWIPEVQVYHDKSPGVLGPNLKNRRRLSIIVHHIYRSQKGIRYGTSRFTLGETRTLWCAKCNPEVDYKFPWKSQTTSSCRRRSLRLLSRRKRRPAGWNTLWTLFYHLYERSTSASQICIGLVIRGWC